VNLRRATVFIVISAGIVVAAWYYLGYQRNHPSTQDAYLGMHVTHIATQVSGSIKSVEVGSHQAVHQGDVLFTVDPAPFKLVARQAEARLQQAREALQASDAKVAAARTQVDAARAKLLEAENHSARIRDLVAKGYASKDDGDAIERSLKDARESLGAAKAELVAVEAARGASGDDNAAIKLARAALDQAHLDLQHCSVRAPADGVVGAVEIRPGGFVNEGRDLFALVETARVWVDANFKETDLAHIHPGQDAQVTIDLLPGKTFNGRVDSLSPASGTAFSLLPPENATGNWVKVTQRFPVRISILDPVAGMRLGASSEVTIDVSNTGS
jgi:membrane fusion protein (multidrug efflux system)